MERWSAECLELGRIKGYLTYSELNDHLPKDQLSPDKLYDLLLLMEKETIELRDEPEPLPAAAPTLGRQEETSSPKTAPLADFEQRIPSLEADLASLLAHATGPDFPKRLFWELLSYDRVNKPLPFSVLPVHFRSDLAGAALFARAGSLYVCYLHLLVSALSSKVERPILGRLAGQWPVVLVLFGNFAETEWDFCWTVDGRARETQRIMVDADEHAVGKLARLLSGLRAVDSATGQTLPELELAKEFDRVFAKSPMKKRERLYQNQTDLIFRAIRNWSLLTVEQEQDLSWRLHNFRDQGAREKLVCANLRLVIWVAQRYQGRGLDFEDLIQEGCLGLLKAADRFDPAFGTRFGTFATWWIRQAISRAVADKARTIRIPVHMIEAMSKLRKTSKKLLQEMGREPTIEETAKAAKMSSDKIRRVLDISQRPMSLDSPERKGARGCSARFIEDHSVEPPGSAGTREMLKNKIEQVLKTLTYREREIIMLRYGLGDGYVYTLEEVGHIFHVTRERVRQIEAKAFEKIQQPVRRRLLEGFLDGTATFPEMNPCHTTSSTTVAKS